MTLNARITIKIINLSNNDCDLANVKENMLCAYNSGYLWFRHHLDNNANQSKINIRSTNVLWKIVQTNLSISGVQFIEKIEL